MLRGGQNVSRETTVPEGSRPNKEILTSRLLATMAAACLLAVVVAQVLNLGPEQATRPRDWVVAVVCCLLGVRIVAHTRHHVVGWLILAMGLSAALTVGVQVFSAPLLTWLGTWVWWPSYALLPVTTLVFPNGRLLSARWWPVLVACVLGVLLPSVGIGIASWPAPATFWSEVVDGTADRGFPLLITVVGILLAFAGLIGSLVSLVVRWRRADPDQRPLRLWTAGCTALLIPAWFFDFVGATWGMWVFAAAFPIVVILAILWYGLYDIELLIHRFLFYGLLIVILAAAYLLVVVAFTSSLPTQANVVGTVAVALALGPLHRQLRRLVDRWLYGDRSDPYRALTQLGERLANPLPPDKVLSEVASTIGASLKLPYVAIQEGPPTQPRLLATHGRSHSWQQLTFPLEHDGRPVGTLVAEVRAPDEHLGRGERNLLTALARQVALAIRSAQLAEELRRASEEREEDLVNLTDELHDAVGPSVEGIRLQADALRRSIDNTLTQAISKLDHIVNDLTTVSADVRDLSRNLRPRELRSGLLSAVCARAAQFEHGGLHVRVHSAGTFEGLPDGVERAAYRIVSEALTNVERYARATSCDVQLTHDTEGLEVSVVDDGKGIGPQAVKGKGMESMRRRCERRGGSFQIVSSSRGTRVLAYLPLHEPVMSINSV
jgi:two-component system, NarL family, sensor kinase